MVLMLNRTREYGADHFSACEGRAPGALASALVKIGYGMVRETSEARRLTKESKKNTAATKTLQTGRALALMGIASASHSDALALGTNSPEDAARVMRWDLVNPWARFYELSSTHPLTAMRLRGAESRSKGAGAERAVFAAAGGARALGGIPIEFVFWAAPLVCGFLFFSWEWLGRDLRHRGIVAPPHFMAWLLVALGVTWAARNRIPLSRQLSTQTGGRAT